MSSLPESGTVHAPFAFPVLADSDTFGAGQVGADGRLAFAALPETDQAPTSALATSFAAELAALRAQARAEGFEAGRVAGLADADAQVAAAVAAARADAAQVLAADRAALAATAATLSAAIDAVHALAAPTAEQMTSTMAVSAFALAEAIVGRDLTETVSAAADSVQRALALCPGDGPVTLRVHPDDVATVREYVTLRDGAVLVADATVEPGGAVAAFGASEVDAQISGALARAKAALHA
jgi:flagellar assembly protein FliH